MRRPSNNSITLGYGVVMPAYGYTADSPHLGVDFSFQPDATIYAPEGGTIVFVGGMGTAGNAVELQGANGRKWRFCHLESFKVSTGQNVSEGQAIGIMGSTGYAFGRHLHLVLFVNGQRANPMDYLPGQVAGATTERQEMITKDDVHLIRIISSEVKGWDFNSVHNGDTDAREAEAWVGQPWTKLIEEAWLEKPSESFRNKRIASLSYYDQRRPQVESQVTDLQARVDTLSAENTRLSTDLYATKNDTKIAELEAIITSLKNDLEFERHKDDTPIFEPTPTPSIPANDRPTPAEPTTPEAPQTKQPSLLTRLLMWLLNRKK